MDKRVCLYARTAHYNEEALKQQITLLDTYAKEHNLTVVMRLSEGGSGKDGNREGIKCIKRLAKEKKIDAIIVKDISRLFRNIYFFQHFSETMKESGVEIISIENSYAVDFVTKLCYNTDNSPT